MGRGENPATKKTGSRISLRGKPIFCFTKHISRSFGLEKLGSRNSIWKTENGNKGSLIILHVQ